MPQNFQKSFNLYLHDKYPATKERGLFIRDNLISPVTLKISRETLAQAQSVATACFELRNLLKYQEHVAAQSGELARFDPKNFSLFMSYDFHQTENGLKLIEINTNAAFSLVAWELYNYRNVDPGESFHEQFKGSLHQAFRDEMKLSTGRAEPTRIAIADDAPESQGMFIEFAMFVDVFKSWGWESEIIDTKDLKFSDGRLTSAKTGASFDFVYYRSTNFLFEGFDDIKAAYLARQACLSPNPHEYLLLADKSRLIDITNPELLRGFGLGDTHIKTLQTHVPFMKDAKSLSAEDLWQLRKKVFFKPKRAYAGKEVYKGANITRKVFEQIAAGDFVAQELVPAPTLSLKLPSGESQDFKYDLRFYTYKDEIQMICARFYQGQVTNFRTPGSGFAAVEIE